MIRLSRLISDNMIIHKDKPVRIWGWADAGATVRACIAEDISASSEALPDGSFDIELAVPKPGAGYTITVSEIKAGRVTDQIVIKNVAVGLVYIMCGQSNAGFPMSRVRDTYPEEWLEPDNDKLRTFKIEENFAFKEPVKDVLTGSWRSAGSDSIDAWCAVGYFAAKKLSAQSGYHVGIIDATQGGSPIESWMSREWLADYPDRLRLADKYCDDELIRKILNDNATLGTKWIVALNESDKGIEGHWERVGACEEADGWKSVELPAFLWKTEIGHTIGSVWLKKEFEVEADELITKDAHLWLGTMTDANVTYVNGVKVGETEYCYPPRRYLIPAGVLHKGLNEVTIRLTVEHGMGRITPHKLLAIFTGDTVRYIDEDDNECIRGAENLIDLSGLWHYRVGAAADEKPMTEFLCWKPTALYNGVLAPCLNYRVGGFIWYQGESNTGETSGDYYDLTLKQAEGIRKACGDDRLPYIYTRLPRFELNCYEGGPDYDESSMSEEEYISLKKKGWDYICEVQEKLNELPDMYMADTADLGEAYDLHPQDKKPVGERYADILNSIIMHA